MPNVIYKILDFPIIYNLSQRLLGGRRIQNAICLGTKKILDETNCLNVLDVGCGTGLYRNIFPEKYTGIDINPNYIETCKKNLKGDFVVGDATSICFDDMTFDLVSTIGVLHHLNETQTIEMLREMKRVCKKNGHIVIVDGLIPSNRLNFLGFALAKLDRGKFKKYFKDFQKIIELYFGDADDVKILNRKVFPSELVFVVIRKK